MTEGSNDSSTASQEHFLARLFVVAVLCSCSFFVAQASGAPRMVDSLFRPMVVAVVALCVLLPVLCSARSPYALTLGTGTKPLAEIEVCKPTEE